MIMWIFMKMNNEIKKNIAYYTLWIIVCMIHFLLILTIYINFPNVFDFIKKSMDWLIEIIKIEILVELLIAVIINVPFFCIAYKIIIWIIKKMFANKIC